MSGFNQSSLVDKLVKLNNTQQSIETVSSWCTFYRKEARKVVQTWEAEFVKAPNMQKKLCMMYLANDILQNSRKKGPDFVNEFYHTLQRPVGHIFKHGDAKVQKAVERLVAIWEERKVFGLSGTKHLKVAMAGAETPRKASGAPPSTTNGRSGVDGRYPELEPLAASLADANNAAARNSGLAESCSRSLRGDVLQQGNMSELEAGQKLLNEYAASLEAEAAARQQVINLLKSLLQQQEEGSQRVQAQLHACGKQLAQFSTHMAGHSSPVAPLGEQYSPTAEAHTNDAWDPEEPADDAAHAVQPQPPLPPGASPGALQASAMAAQLAAGGGAARLLEILAALPKDQQHEIGRNLEALVKPGESNATETRTLTDDDEYDPEQGSIEF
ncbi:g10818 [Coccomyxa elongata]